jgi:hypothetical protein
MNKSLSDSSSLPSVPNTRQMLFCTQRSANILSANGSLLSTFFGHSAKLSVEKHLANYESQKTQKTTKHFLKLGE